VTRIERRRLAALVAIEREARGHGAYVVTEERLPDRVNLFATFPDKQQIAVGYMTTDAD